MKIILIVIIFIFACFIIDKMVCFIYCSLKHKSVVVSKDEINIKNEKRIVENRNLKWKIKQLLYGWMMYSVMRLGRVPIQKYRIFILKHIYRMNIAEKVVIYGNFKIRAPWNISIGKGTVVGDGVQLDGRNGLVIGSNVNISSDVYIYTEQHDINDEYFESAYSGGRVVIMDRAWLSSRTTILPKVIVGEGAVLASGAVATKNLEDFSVNAGIPAKKIADRSKELKYEFEGEYIPFY